MKRSLSYLCISYARIAAITLCILTSLTAYCAEQATYRVTYHHAKGDYVEEVASGGISYGPGPIHCSAYRIFYAWSATPVANTQSRPQTANTYMPVTQDTEYWAIYYSASGGYIIGESEFTASFNGVTATNSYGSSSRLIDQIQWSYKNMKINQTGVMSSRGLIYQTGSGRTDGYLQSALIKGVYKVEYHAARKGTNVNFYMQYSTDGTNWTSTPVTLGTTSTDMQTTQVLLPEVSDYYLRFYCEEAGTSGTAYVYLDDITVYKKDRAYYNTDYSTSCDVSICLTYNTQGGTPLDPVTEEGWVILPTTTRPGRTLLGWYSPMDKHVYRPGEPFQLTHTTTLTAQWSAESMLVRWGEDNVLVMYTGATEQTVTPKVDGTKGTAQSLSAIRVDHGVYKVATPSLLGKGGKTLTLTFSGGDSRSFDIPVIVSGEKATDGLGLSASQRNKDVVILKGGKLTASATGYQFRDMTVYGGGKLVVPSGKKLVIQRLILRAGGRADDGSYDDVRPEVVTLGTLKRTDDNVCLDFVTTVSQYYAFAVPYPTNTLNIQYPQDIYGSNVAADNHGSFALQYYDGAARATTGHGWADLEEDPVRGADLTPGIGYTLLGMPKKVKVNGTTARQAFGIHRITMPVFENSWHESSAYSVKVSSHSASAENNKGWNLLGSPYLSNYGEIGVSNSNVCALGMLVVGNQGYEHSGNVRYITTSTDGNYYIQTMASSAAIPPFTCFFVQINNSGKINFAAASHSQSAPSRMLVAEEREIAAGLILRHEAMSDRTGLLIGPDYTDDYETNADLSKWQHADINLYSLSKDGNMAFQALNSELAEDGIALGYIAPEAGEYEFVQDTTQYAADAIEAMYLTDYETGTVTDLRQSGYTFSTQQGTYDQRFKLTISLVEGASDISTALPMLQTGERAEKVLIGQHIYIRRGQHLYNINGCEVQMTND